MNPEASCDCFWILTLQWPAGDVILAETMTGQFTAQPGATRAGVFAEILAAVKRSLGAGAGKGVVLFFSLEPDALMPAAGPGPAAVAGGDAL